MLSDQNSMLYEPIPQFDKSSKKSCNCRNSRCLKLYCECFSLGEYCRDCNCNDCLNLPQFEAYRTRAIHSTLERNPTAFRPKIPALRNGKHTRGCACRKSNCLKKYCECFQAGVSCADYCRCKDCRNFEGYLEGSPSKIPKIELPPNYRDFLEDVLKCQVTIEEEDSLCCNEEVIAADGLQNSSSKTYTYSPAYQAQEAFMYQLLIEKIKQLVKN